MKRSHIALLAALMVSTSIFSGCQKDTAKVNNVAATESTQMTSKGDEASKEKVATGKKPKYIFLFIGDGMSHVQMNSAQVYNGDNTNGKVQPKKLSFADFPVNGLATTYDSTSFAPDSASTATSISSGIKTHSGVIGLGVDKKTKPENITEKLKKEGMKVGIVSTVTINHATPAAFYAHNVSRNNYYDIAKDMVTSNVDYFGGGEISKPTGAEKKDKDMYTILAENGYKVARTKEEISKLNKDSGKAYAVTPKVQDSGSMPYQIDRKESEMNLSDFVSKGIEVLDNEKGFFMMVESGKVDWACHANDAKSAIEDVLELETAVNKAIEFAEKHKDETLILVTGDHETGGMTIGQATTGYNTAFNLLKNQKMSFVAFDDLIASKLKENPSMTFDQVMPLITDNFGIKKSADGKVDPKVNPMDLTEYEMTKLQKAFEESKIPEKERKKTPETEILYGEYNPLSVTITHIINNKAGIGWTSYSHTGTPVPVFASGARSEEFSGSYDNTDIFKKLVKVTEVK